MKKTIISIILCAAALITPLALTAAVAEAIGPQGEDSFFAELKYKYERLKSTDSPKVVLIGGSNLAFGINSKLLEEYLGMPVVNFGLYAALGTKPMLDLAKGEIKKGDIVVICPELDSQTYSLYYGGRYMLTAIDGTDLLTHVGISNFPTLLASLPEFASSKVYNLRNNIEPKSEGIYSLSSFDEYGDIRVEREYNTRPDYGASSPINLSESLVTEEFTDYLNDYAKSLERRGAKVWFSFPPMNEAAISVSDEEKAGFYKKLGESLDFPVISGLDDYILDREFFYDTNFHLTTKGATQRTLTLAGDIMREAGMTDKLESFDWSLRLTPPRRPDDYFAGSKSENDAENSLDFVFEKTDGGLVVTGLSEAGKTRETLTLPGVANDLPVVAIGKNAFSGGAAKTLVIPESSPLGLIESDAFAGSALERIEARISAENLSASEESFRGSNCYFYLKPDLYAEYAVDYIWSGLMKFVKLDA